MPSRYNLRNQSPDGGPQSIQKTHSSPAVPRSPASPRSPPSHCSPPSHSSPASPNGSGYSSGHSYRNQSLHDDDDDDDDDDGRDSQEEDEVDHSYASTVASSTASTPSPSQIRGPKKGGTRHENYSNIYPSLSQLSDFGIAEERRPDSKASLTTRNIDQRETYKESSGIGLFNLIAVATVVIAFIVCLIFVFPGNGAKPRNRTESFQDFVSKVDDDLRHVFKSQEARTWKSIKSSVRHVLNSTEPEYPAVILFAVEKNYNVVASCLARKVASLFNLVTKGYREEGYHDMRLLSHLEASKQKENLDDQIHTAFRSGRSVVIDHLEALSPEASLLLHGVCDNDNAPFKNVFIGIVFYVEKELSPYDVDKELTNYLSKDLDIDKIGALLTRINNNAVVIKPEHVTKDFSSACQ